jgi:cytochrome c-type biogenesis protein CcmH
LLLWIIIALLTAAAILAVLAPLARAPKGGAAAAHAARVYRDQLDELERDKAEGRISASEAEAARAEIARRLIAVDNEAGGEAGAAAPVPGRQNARRGVAVMALLGIPALSLALYLGLGAPSLPGAPLAARLSAPVEDDDVEMLVAKVEEHLAKNPEDGRGWEVIAPVYLRLGRAADAAQAYRSTIRLLGSSAVRETGLGQAILASESGIVTAEARTAFEAAAAQDPQAPAPKFFLALAAEQEGKTEEAARIWRALLSESPADALWRPATEEALARVAPGEAPPAGPTGEEVAAVQDIPPDEQAKMIEGMVGRLAERLKAEPDDVEGWLRLIRSYVVLGRANEAAEAARSALAGVRDHAARERVEALIADLGVTPAGAATP